MRSWTGASGEVQERHVPRLVLIGHFFRALIAAGADEVTSSVAANRVWVLFNGPNPLVLSLVLARQLLRLAFPPKVPWF